MLALAQAVAGRLDCGEIEDLAAVARGLGITRARMTQVLQLRNLAAPIQEALLLGRLVASERSLRAIAIEPSWSAQLSAAASLKGAPQTLSWS